jgi:simple sugar transport system ATP-binding protein
LPNITEDRKVEGFFDTMSVARNIYLGILAKFPRGRRLLPTESRSKPETPVYRR